MSVSLDRSCRLLTWLRCLVTHPIEKRPALAGPGCVWCPICRRPR